MCKDNYLFSKEGGYDNRIGISNRAIKAYYEGLKPLSAWNKTNLMEEIEKEFGQEVADLAKNHTFPFLRNHFLCYKEWHHTSLNYDCTAFYGINKNINLSILNTKKEKVDSSVFKEELVFLPLIAEIKKTLFLGNFSKNVKYKIFGKTNGRIFISWCGEKILCKDKNFKTVKFLTNLEGKNEYRKCHKNTTMGYSKWLKSKN